MDNRFSNIFPGLTEERAIELLTVPLEELEDKSERYIAASHLVNFPTERSINALIATVKDQNPVLEQRIARRKALETLGRLKASQALQAIRSCLADADGYTVENAVWAIGEIGSSDPEILEEIAQQLDKPGQTYRLIIQVLAKLNAQPAVGRIARFTSHEDPAIAGAAIAALCQLTGNPTGIEQVVEFLHHPNVNARRSAIQDLMDAKHYAAIGNIATCPVSVVFRLRGIRHLAETGVPAGHLNFAQVEPVLVMVIRDHSQDLQLVHEYDQPPTLEFAINELYQTDFGRCYLATQTLLDLYPDTAPAALMATFADRAHNDYGAHYHVVKLLGWLKYAPAYELLVEALHNRRPQFQKSRAGAAIALGNLGDKRAIPELKAGLETSIWELKYACLMALEQLGDSSGNQQCAGDPDWLVRAKATRFAVGCVSG
ncbi:MAG: HEAT repeat domain-containing protein [Oscillatoria sp. Prado101]|jgi:bilin biosynthesis protein|nr:HEAT repeat domain-containing protein [Oscillatoria sp. Prado101]